MENKIITSPVKAIRAKCLDCMCDQVNEIRDCPVSDCPLYPFRMGKNPFHKLNITAEQKAERARRMVEARRVKNNA